MRRPALGLHAYPHVRAMSGTVRQLTRQASLVLRCDDYHHVNEQVMDLTRVL